MEILKYVFLGLVLIVALITLVLAARTKKAFKFLFYNAVLGLAVFFVLYFTKKFTGVFLPLNIYTFLSSLFLGIPAIIAFLIFNLIF